MIRFFKRRLALKDFVTRFPGELHRRFGEKRFYTIEEVNRVMEMHKSCSAFASYAHALFCAERDFEEHYALPQFKGLYHRLRSQVSKKYLGGGTGFDAADLVRYARQSKRPDPSSGTDCGLGEDYPY